MRNPFRNKIFKPKKQEDNLSQEPIKKPWNRKPSEKGPTQSNNTIIGKKPDKPYLDQKNEQSSFGSGYQCPECSYPLRVQVSHAAPCPNCGFSGDVKKEEIPKAQQPETKQTVNFGKLNFGKLSGERKFSLINESSPDMSVSAELGEVAEITLGREELDPGNSSISGSGHIILKENKGMWFVKDISSNGATFIQALQYQPIQEGTRIILGNRIFRFSTGSPAPAQPTGNKTMQFGQFNLSDAPSHTVMLIDELQGTAKNYSGQHIELNRMNIDPEEVSISSKQHASIENRQGNWMIVDRSSNKATFVQVLHEVHLPDQTRLILGNKVFKFEVG